ncbi:methyltransferase domain-containing protein [Roseomonas sp. SSH11]|uniref:Methyltransferase domain-containing protein n=1 Tax=Pararoseomonas baculiformis TaxID=2820812 RepID=A0ABS4AG93_9PROT|nr:methyltransferase [Pararoseomonas baculiformis]MBP0446057.1 methyltransferase domain-containing protein [Pararoseomonas baculiformis]
MDGALTGPVHTLLDGQVRLRQPAKGLRAGLDAVMLAASVAARPGDTVLDAGCGPGGVFLCVLARCPGARVVAVERDPALAELARENAALNGWAHRVEVLTGDVADPALRTALPRCEHAVSNPPYWPGGTAPPEPIRAGATHGGETGLVPWARLLGAVLGRAGRASLVLPAARLDDGVLAFRKAGLGGIEVMPFWPRAGRPAKRVLLRARHAPRAPLTLLPGLTLHGPDGWTVEADKILKGGGLHWGEGP